MKTEIKFATHRLIDSVWTIRYIEREGGVEVLSYDRDNKYGYINERKLNQVRTVESDDRKRTLTAIRIASYKQFNQDFADSVEYKVLNPKYIFSYKD